MKRIGLILLILISCIAVMTSCSDDPKKRYLTFASDSSSSSSSSSSSGGEDPVFNGPSSVTATDGNYKNKVGVNWSTITEAVSYNIYRADSEVGPFITPIANIKASELANPDSSIVSGTTPDTVTTTATSGTCDRPVYQATYQSARNIGNGIFIMGGIEPLAEHYTIEVIIGGVSKGVAHFSGGLFGRIWTQSMIVNTFNNVLGNSGTCYAVTVDGKKYIKIVSTQSIQLKNDYDIAQILWVPLNFLDSSITSWDTEIYSEKVLVSCSDTTSPSVTLTSPANGATDIALNANVSVAFSEPIKQSTLNDSTFTLYAGASRVSGTVSNTGVFTPAFELSPNTVYTATITSDVTDLSDNALASDYVWTFTTCESVSYYYVDNDVSGGSHYYYVITAVDKDGNESTKSPVEEGFAKANENAPSKVPNCSASDGLSGGITVTWGAATGASYYKVYRIDTAGTQTQIGGDIDALTYTDTSVAPGLFYYKVTPFNGYGEGGSSDKDAGYRAATDKEFFDMVYKEEKSALNRSKKIANQSTGDEYIYDIIGDGYCYISISGSLSSATVNITFTDYCDLLLTLNGNQLTAIKNPLGSKTGTITGQINATGIYNGYVIFNLGMANAVVTSGTYSVSQDGGTTVTTIPYNYVPAN